MNSNDLLVKILDKQDEISKDITEIKVVQTAQHVTLNEHIRRTELAEQNINLLREEIKPIKKHVAYVDFVAKSIGFVSVLGGIATAVIKIIQFLSK